MKKFAGLRPKTYSYLKDYNDECKKAKGTDVKMLEQSILMIQKLFCNIETIWLIFIKTLRIIIQIKNVKY